MRRIEHKKVKLAVDTLQNTRFSAEKGHPLHDGRRRTKRIQYGGIPRYKSADVNIFGLQRDREGTNDVSKATSLDQRINFRCDRKDASGLHAVSPSIIGCVIKQM